MTDIVNALKAEITRLARKEIRSHLQPMKKALVQAKSQNAALRAEVQALKAQVKALGKTTKSVAKALPDEEQNSTRQRFTAKGFITLRKRLGLSLVEMGKLVGASDQSVRKWEEGSSVPREKYQKVIFQLRSVGKRELAARLSA